MAQEVTELQNECGKHEITAYVPGTFESLMMEFSDLTCALNSIGTWSYMVNSAWNIGIFWVLMSVSSGGYRALGIVRPNQMKISTLATLTGKVSVKRDNVWVEKETADIVLGDVI